jgi:diaminohydroxyphosphoribosylaminopyrimidine deaminase/5-amino-6-(5-phosphoribosylamino)uracil reductase
MGRNSDDKFMRRCLDLAAKAEGMTYPNPMVGAVVVHDNVIIGEGYHLKAGGPHAEVFAISSVADKTLLRESVLYVSLEPCTHYGKTPPCTELILESGIPEIVIGTEDTSSKVAGTGIKRLAAAGRKVISGVLEQDCRMLNRRFFTYHEKKRPYITLKWAQSSDDFIDTDRVKGEGTKPNWISGNTERALVHKWRAQEEAILVGAGTLRVDSPRLNVRDWSGNDPVKIILSNSGNVSNPLTNNRTKGTIIVFTRNSKADTGAATKVIINSEEGASVQIARYLYYNNLQSLFVEGGAMVLKHFIETGMWDEARIFRGRTNFNSGVKAPAISGRTVKVTDFGTSTLEILVNESGRTTL